MILKYEPSSEPLHITAKELFLIIVVEPTRCTSEERKPSPFMLLLLDPQSVIEVRLGKR